MESKKSIQLSQAFGAVLTLVLVAVLVIIAIVIFVSLEVSFAGAETSSITDNESITIDGTGISSAVVASAACGFTGWTPTTVINCTAPTCAGATNETLVLTTDYTVNADGTLTNVTFVATPLLVTYDYTWGSSACNASEDMVSEFDNYTSLVGLVGTIIFLGLVIGVLVASFAFGGRRV